MWQAVKTSAATNCGHLVAKQHSVAYTTSVLIGAPPFSCSIRHSVPLGSLDL